MNLLDRLIDPLIEREGGYVNDPSDSGGETKYGITVAVARENGYPGAMADLPLAEAKRIYRKRYWDVNRLDDIAAISVPLAEEIFDTGVNCGVGVAGTFLQRVLNVMNKRGASYPDLKIDGNVGGKTIAALQSFSALRGSRGLSVLLTALNCLQGARYIDLAERREKDEDFVYGWIKERVHTL